jgi:hypothetical protein
MHSAFRRSRGQALVEYAIVFPLQLMLTLAIIQLAHLFIAKQVMEYAAFCATRAAIAGLTTDEARTAALIPLSKIAGPTGVPEGTKIEIPGWGELGRSDAADEKTCHFWVGEDTLDGQRVMRCEIEHMVELRVPIGNVVAYTLGDVVLGIKDFDRDTYGSPHLRMRAGCVLAEPWGE